MTDDEIKQAYWSTAYHDEWYSGNNPGKQKRLTKAAGEMRQKMRERGLDTKEIDMAVGDGRMPPYHSDPEPGS
jgi:hypothetical protein